MSDLEQPCDTCQHWNQEMVVDERARKYGPIPQGCKVGMLRYTGAKYCSKHKSIYLTRFERVLENCDVL